ncbi:MAG TPA: hypothetical protein VF796_10810 [Humisphaera sp.]
MTDPASPPQQPPRAARSSVRGRWTIVAIFALGFAVLGGLYLSPKGRPPAEPAGLSPDLPPRAVQFVVLDCGPLGPAPDVIATGVRAVDGSPDVVVLLGLDGSAAAPTAEALGMRASFHPALSERAQPTAGDRGRVGLCVLSRHGLYGTEVVRAGDGRIVGVRTVAAIDGHRVPVAAVDVTEGLSVPTVAVTVGRTGGALFAAGPAAGGKVDVITRKASPDAIGFALSRP